MPGPDASVMRACADSNGDCFADPMPMPTPRSSDGEVQLVQALGKIIMRAQEMQVERILEQGRQLEAMFAKQEETLAKLEKQIVGRPSMPWIDGRPSMPCIHRKLMDSEMVNKGTEGVQSSRPKQSDCPRNDTEEAKCTLEMDTTSSRIAAITPGTVEKMASRSDTSVREYSGKSLEATVKTFLRPKSRKASWVHDPNRCGASLVMSNAFFLLVGVMVCLNTVFILVQTDIYARNPGVQVSHFYMFVESLFFLFFAVELALRIWVFRLDFLFGPPSYAELSLW